MNILIVISIYFASLQIAISFLKIIFQVKVNDDAAHPIYKYMMTKKSGPEGPLLKWNFTKFLVDKNGQVVMRYEPDTNPMDIANVVEQLLQQ